jgi:16S rRNA G966 N2-methylase RsmD
LFQIIECVKKCYDKNIIITSITCDGAKVNTSTFKKLGANLKVNDLKTYFTHPCDENKKIYIFLDPPHMMKLVRNATKALGKIISDKGIVEFEYFKKLYDLQESLKFRLGEFNYHLRKFSIFMHILIIL